MAEKKSKKFTVPGSLKARKWRFGGYAVLSTVLIIATVLLLNVGVKALEDNWALRLDLSFNSLTKFSDSTKSTLKELKEDVHFYGVFTTGSENAQMIEVMERYRAAAGGHIDVTIVDPDKNPGLLSRFQGGGNKISSNSVIVSNAEGTRYKVYAYVDLVDLQYDTDQNSSTYGQAYITGYKYEKMFTQALLYVTAEKTPTAYFTVGHGEVSSLNNAALHALLRDNNYDVVELGLGDALPEAGSNVIIIMAPKKDLTEEERVALLAYAEAGGSIIFSYDYDTPTLPNFEALLAFYGTGYEQGVVLADTSDTQHYYPMYPNMLLPKLGEHAITDPITAQGNMILVIPDARPVRRPEMDRSEFVFTPLLSSYEASYLVDVTDVTRTTSQKQAGDKDGPFVLAAAIQHTVDYYNDVKNGRLVLVGSTAMMNNDVLINSFNNGEFVLSAVRWSVKEDTVNLSVVSKRSTRGTLKISSYSELYTAGAIVVIVIPVLVLVCGIVVWIKRRHL